LPRGPPQLQRGFGKADVGPSRWNTSPATPIQTIFWLGIGALIGAWLCGSANTLRMSLVPSHSIAGALAAMPAHPTVERKVSITTGLNCFSDFASG
jgi:hypothetical protein